MHREREHERAVFEDVLSVTLTGTMRCCTLAREKLRTAAGRGGGAIVNTASVLAYQGGALVPGYGASKGGVAQLTKSLALAYAAVLLCSPAARFMTGAIVPVDGGYLIA